MKKKFLKWPVLLRLSMSYRGKIVLDMKMTNNYSLYTK